MTPKDASTIKARKTSTESAASPQTVRIATSIAGMGDVGKQWMCYNNEVQICFKKGTWT